MEGVRMKLYLAGPMRGLPLCNFPAFDAAAAWLTSKGHIVFKIGRAHV